MKQFIEDTASKATSFSVNFSRKDIKVNGKYIVKDGTPQTEIPKFDGDILEYLDELYDDYAHSIPSENSDKRLTHFRPLPYEELSDEDLMFGEHREKARLKLEMFTLLIYLERGWTEAFGKGFFYQSESFKSLVVYSGWFK